MSAFQVERDATFRSSYKQTIDAARQTDPSPTERAWLQGLMTSPLAVRALAGRLPEVADQMFDPQYRKMIEHLAGLYGAQAARARV